ncbi:outer membrane beta-barrel protein [Providencia stuartii]|nr:outer membrane beta-barrel protein [Providencia stuartii]RMA13499.1 porin family protein [Providencia stuartii]
MAKITPYIRAGIGLTNLKHNSSYQYREWDPEGRLTDDNHWSKSKTKNNFAWRLGLGAQYAVNDNLSMDLSYRYRRWLHL